MIHFSKPYVIEDNSHSILKCNFEIDSTHNTIWFSVEKQYGQFLCYERSDAFVIAVLNYAMRNNHDIICDAPLSEDLFYNIDRYLIDAIVEYNPTWYRTKIKAEVAADPLPCAGAVGTGISCGVDSLHVLASETSEMFPRHKVTHLTFNNVGSHGEGECARILYQNRLKRPQKFAEEYGFQFVASDSNLMDVIHQSHFKTHTYSSLFAVYCLQKLYSVYYYASGGYSYDDFTLEDKSSICCGSYEMLSLPLLSTHNLRIYSEGENKSRSQKLSVVASYKPSYKYLNVCLKGEDNCGKCEKCVRTILGLDSIGRLELYRDVFDVDYYKSHKRWYIKQMLIYMAHGKHDYFELYKSFKKYMTPDLFLYKFYMFYYIKMKECVKDSFVYHFIKR